MCYALTMLTFTISTVACFLYILNPSAKIYEMDKYNMDKLCYDPSNIYSM